MARLTRLLAAVRWRVVAAVCVCLVGFGVVASARQDTTTLLALFLRDLRAGTLGTLTAITRIRVGDGTAGAPSYSFSGDTDNGLYRITTDTVGVSAGGTARSYWNTGGFVTTTLNFDTSNLDVSLSRGAANRLDLASGDSFNLVSGTLQVTSGALQFGTTPVISASAVTVTSAGTSPSVSGATSAAFRVNVGTGGTATTIVLAMPITAANGWNCDASNITGAAANRANQHIVQQSSTTTAVTVQNQTISTGAALAFTAGDIVRFLCTAY